MRIRYNVTRSVKGAHIQIRYAGTQDILGIDNLLSQVLTVHHNGRPDLFKANARKYNEDELKEILEDRTRPVFVADNGAGNTLGYAFCVFQQHINDDILTDIRPVISSAVFPMT